MKQYDGKTARGCKVKVSTLITKGLLLKKCLLEQKMTYKMSEFIKSGGHMSDKINTKYA